MIAEQLRQAIEESGQNLHQLASACGVSQPVLYRFMAGQRGLNLATAERLAAHFGLELAQQRKRPAARKNRRKSA